MSHALALSPGGHLLVEPDKQAEPKLSRSAAARLTEGFGVSSARGLELLASEFLHEPLPVGLIFWRGLAQRFFTALCHSSGADPGAGIAVPKPAETEMSALAEAAPPMKGLEYLNSAVLTRLWDDLEAHVRAVIEQSEG